MCARLFINKSSLCSLIKRGGRGRKRRKETDLERCSFRHSVYCCKVCVKDFLINSLIALPFIAATVVPLAQTFTTLNLQSLLAAFLRKNLCIFSDDYPFQIQTQKLSRYISSAFRNLLSFMQLFKIRDSSILNQLEPTFKIDQRFFVVSTKGFFIIIDVEIRDVP